MRALPLLILSCIALLATCPAPAQSVQRCMGANGQPVYTDRRCDDIGAVQRVPPAAAAGAARWTRQGCPRRLSELVGEIGAAIQSHDVNRLSAIHDWRGVPAAAATSLFDRLEASGVSGVPAARANAEAYLVSVLDLLAKPTEASN